MRQALCEAAEAAMRGDVPVGAVVLRGGELIAAAGNRREADQDPTAHAEVLALRQAAKVVGLWRLNDCVLYVTQEPCPMCAGAAVNARLGRLVFGCDNPKAGAVKTLYQMVEDPRLNHRLPVRGGVLAEECGALLSLFFRRLRA